MTKIGKNKYVIWLIIILVIGVFFRLINAQNESIWCDEANEIRISQMNLGDLTNFLKSDLSPPLHYYLVHGWMKFISDTEISLRFMAIIISLAGVIAIYFLGKEIYSTKVGLLAAALMSFSPLQITYGVEIRMYSLLTLFGILSTLFFIKYYKKSNKKNIVLYIVTSGLMIYTHYVGFFILAAHGLFIFILWIINKKINLQIRQWLIINLIIFLLFLPWLPITVNRIWEINQSYPGNHEITRFTNKLKPEGPIYFWAFPLYFMLAPPPLNNNTLHPGVWVVTLGILVFIFYRKFDHWSDLSNYEHKRILLILYLTVPLIFLFIANITILRYAIVAAPALYIILSYFLVSRKNYYVRYTLILILFISLIWPLISVLASSNRTESWTSLKK